MSDTPSAAPATPAATPAQVATQEALSTLPADPKAPKIAASDDVEDSGEDLVESPAEAKLAAKKAYKLKVNGKDLEVDEAELLKRAQMGYSADEKWQETAKMRKQMDGFIHLLQTNPAKALEQMGYDVDKMAEDRIRLRIEEMQKSPEQLEREKMQKELEEMRADREREKSEGQQKEMQRIQDQFAIEIENDISSALDDNSFGFPKIPYVVKRIADTMILAVQEGIKTNNERLKNITAKDVLPLVRDEIQREQRELYSLTPDEVFEQMIGKERLNKYRRAKIKKPAVKPSSANDVKATGTKELQKAKDDTNKNQKKEVAKDFFRNLGSR